MIQISVYSIEDAEAVKAKRQFGGKEGPNHTLGKGKTRGEMCMATCVEDDRQQYHLSQLCRHHATVQHLCHSYIFADHR